MMRPQHVEVRRREIALQVTKPLIEQATVLTQVRGEVRCR
jgi:hypothetical protein